MLMFEAPGHVPFLVSSPLQVREQKHREIKPPERQHGWCGVLSPAAGVWRLSWPCQWG